MSTSDADPPSRLLASRSRPIFRVRTGCLRCRVRKKKCDELKPTCRACKRNRFLCEWPSNLVPPMRERLPQLEPRGSRANEGPSQSVGLTGGEETGRGETGRGETGGGQTGREETGRGETGRGETGRGEAEKDAEETYECPDFSQSIGASPDGMELEPMAICEPAAQQQDNALTVISSSLPISPATSSSTRGSNNLFSHQSDDGDVRDHSSPTPLTSGRPYLQFPPDDDDFPAESEEDCVRPSTTTPAGEMSFAAWNANDDRLDIRQSLFLPRNMSLLPEYGHDAFQLLSHYLAKTAESMSNGFSSSNPFLSQLIPLAFSSDVILQLILTQSAANRAVLHQAQIDNVASRHYSRSVKLFRQRINDHIEGTEVDPLMLAVGALIMCFTETAKGDINGVIFDHLSASTSLLLEALRQYASTIPKELKDFLVEYYSYTATLSLISIDINVSSKSLLDPELEVLAHQLVLSQYVGSLCGCWLDLLLLIPKVFDLGRQWRLCDQDEDEEPAASRSTTKLTEILASFASLHSQVLGWSPHSSSTTDGTLAGRIFQQALLLYLYTSLHSTGQVTGSKYDSLIEATVAQSMSLFDQLSSTVRINTSLCWPIAVIGSCLTNDIWRQTLRNRLNTMLSTIGLGNIQQTLQILEYVWRRPSNDSGPWSICKVMQDHQIWISFA